jgi:hypothetical protein
MTFRSCQVRNKRFDEDRTFTLADKRRSCRTNCFRARHFHNPEEEFSELYDDPLEDTPVIEDLHASNKEYDGRDDTDKEPS